MKNFMKRMSLVLTSVLMASTMVMSASAASANGNTACTGNGNSTIKYYVSGSGCLSDTDLNALLGKLKASGIDGLDKLSGSCPTKPAAVQGAGTSGSAPTQSTKTSDNVTKSNSADVSNTQAPAASGGNVASPAPSLTQGSVSDSSSGSSFETQVVALVNEQRALNGLNPLTLNSGLSNVAETKAQDMHDNNYFSHTSPTYGSPFDMMTAFGISYSSAGENIAMGYATPDAVMNAWMNSPGHRANILNPSYTQIGVGFDASGNYWTQEFIG